MTAIDIVYCVTAVVHAFCTYSANESTSLSDVKVESEHRLMPELIWSRPAAEVPIVRMVWKNFWTLAGHAAAEPP